MKVRFLYISDKIKGASEPPPEDKLCYFIERRDASGVTGLWLNRLDGGFTRDPDKAKQFERRGEAEEFRKEYPLTDCIVTEHIFMADLQTWIDSCIEFEDQPTKEPFGRPNKIFEIIEYEWCKRSHFIPFEMKDIPKGTILEIPPLECEVIEGYESMGRWFGGPIPEIGTDDLKQESKRLRILETKES